MQTPSWPVNLAWAHAMKAAISSCLTWMNSGGSSTRSRAPISPLIPSPGYPKTRRTPQAVSLCRTKSATFSAMAGGLLVGVGDGRDERCLGLSRVEAGVLDDDRHVGLDHARVVGVGGH